MKKRILPAILAGLLCASMGLAGCSDNTGTTNQTGTTAAGDTTTTKAGDAEQSTEQKTDDSGTTGEVVNLDWFLVASTIPSSWDTNQYVMGQITEKTGVTISANIPAEDADTKLNLMLVSGQLPDMVTITNETLIKDMVDAGLVWDLQEFFTTYMPESHIINGGFQEDVKAQVVLRDGGWYSFPSHIRSPEGREIWGLPDATKELWESTDYRSNNGVIFNKTIMDQLGITEDDVSTESKLLAAFEKVKNANLEVDGGKVITFLADGSNYYGGGWKADGGAVGTLTTFFGGMMVDANGTYQSLYRTDGFKHALSFLNECAKRGYVEPNQFTYDRQQREAECRSGRVFCFMGNTADTGFQAAGEWYTPGVVLSDTGATPTLGSNQQVGRGWLQTFIPKSTKNPEAVARFLDFMSSREGLMLWNYGEPEVDWVYNENGLVERTEEGKKKSDDATVTAVGAFWNFCNQNFDQSIMDPSVDKGIVPQCAYGNHPKTYKYNSQAIDNLPGGYIEGNTEMQTITVEIKNYVSAELVDIFLHAVDEADFNARYDALLTQLDTLGLRTLEQYIDEAVQQNFANLGYTLKAVN